MPRPLAIAAVLWAVLSSCPPVQADLAQVVRDSGVMPAGVIGIPVGFVGAAESKQALAANPFGLEYLTVLGRRGGSAIAVAALNAIASTAETTNEARTS